MDCEEKTKMDEDSWGEYGVLSYPISCQRVLTHLRKDMQDDWFTDSLGYEDLFARPENLQEVISILLDEGNGKYKSNKRILRDIPKKGLGIRYSLETDFYDRFIYQSICSFLVQYYDPILSHRVFSHRFDKYRKRERYLFKSRIELWNTFEGVTFTAFRNKQSLLATDLINYFENITIECVREAFESGLSEIKASGSEKLKIRNAITTLCELLEGWAYDGKHGLPQNRDASSFIANVVLSSVDHKMVKMGYDYYRYVDDIRIICESELHSKKALTDLISELRTVGMNINSSKTRILSSRDDASTISEFFPSSDDRTNAIDNMWRSRSRRIVSRSVKYIYEILRECIEGKETQSRQFRFSVNRLCAILGSELFASPAAIADDLAKLLLEAMESQPASTDQFCKLLSVLELSPECMLKIERHLTDPLKSIHGWQNYHLWFLLARKEHKSEGLIRHAVSILESTPESAEVPAIFIWMSVVGEVDHLKILIEGYSNDWSYSKKRTFLLATSTFDVETLRPLFDKLKSDVKTIRTATRARGHFDEKGRPLAKMEKTRLNELYDNISPYD